MKQKSLLATALGVVSVALASSVFGATVTQTGDPAAASTAAGVEGAARRVGPATLDIPVVHTQMCDASNVVQQMGVHQ
jgi:hypothetical protein